MPGQHPIEVVPPLRARTDPGRAGQDAIPALDRLLPHRAGRSATAGAARKDTALGYAIGSSDITDRGKRIFTDIFYNNPVAVALTLMAVFVTINYTLSLIARWLESRSRRRGRTVVRVDEGMDQTGGAA